MLHVGDLVKSEKMEVPVLKEASNNQMSTDTWSLSLNSIIRESLSSNGFNKEDED